MLSNVMQEMGNPFQEDSSDLLSLDTKDIAQTSAAARVTIHISCEKASFEAFLKVLEAKDTSLFHAPIKKTKVDFFQHDKITTSTKDNMIKEDYQLFSKLFISCQTRECDLHDFFQHENQPFPASLSDGGRLHACQKSQLASILEAKVAIPDIEPTADAIIIDGSALINSMPPRISKTFAEYVALEIIPKVERVAAKYKRLHLVFDVYKSSSLKAETRMKRGKAARRRVTENGKLPLNWHSFLRDDTNKT